MMWITLWFCLYNMILTDSLWMLDKEAKCLLKLKHWKKIRKNWKNWDKYNESCSVLYFCIGNAST